MSEKKNPDEKPFWKEVVVATGLLFLLVIIMIFVIWAEYSACFCCIRLMSDIRWLILNWNRVWTVFAFLRENRKVNTYLEGLISGKACHWRR